LLRSTAFFINGGAGRVICSIPAFVKFAEENPENDFIIVCEGGMDFYKGHPILHKRAYDVWHKGLFENYLKNRNCISPEPYRVWEYYNQKCSLAQAFDIEINNKGIRDLPDPKIYHNKHEIVEAHNIVEEIKNTTGLEKVLVVQPFGRTSMNHPEFVIDGTSRSFTLNDTIQMVNKLKKEYSVIVMTEFPLTFDKDSEHKVAIPQIPNLRIWSAIIEIADHFLGCDSMGQHIAKALNKTATVILGSTYPINISYPTDQNFNIIDVGEESRVYSPIRLTSEEEQDRLNDEIMEMTDKQLNEVIDIVKKRLGPKVERKKTTQKVDSNQVDCHPTTILNRSGV